MPKYYSFLDNDMPGPSKPKPKKVGPATKRPTRRTGMVVPKPAPRTRRNPNLKHPSWAGSDTKPYNVGPQRGRVVPDPKKPSQRPRRTGTAAVPKPARRKKMEK